MDRTPRSWGYPDPTRRAQAYLQRLGLHPGGSWALSWLVLFAGGIWLNPAGGVVESLASCALVALFAGFTWIGALAFAGSRAPLWILPGALALGLARGVIYHFVGPAYGDAFSLVYEPAAIFAAATVVWRASLLEDEPALRHSLALALVGIAVLELADGVAPGLPGLPATAPLWTVLAPATGFLEVAAMWSWIARRELRLERAEDGQRELEDEVARERRTNDLLRRKEAWLFDFFEKAPDLLLVLTPETCEIVRCNRRFSETLGYPRRELVGRSLLDLVEPSSVESVGSILTSGRRRLRNLMLHLVRHDGTELVVLANLALRADSSGVREIRGVLHDVTRLERAQPAEGTDLHRVLAEGAAAGLFHSDETGRCKLVNASFCELTGRSAEAAREHSWLRCVHPDDRRRVEDAWDVAVRDGTVLRIDHRIQSAAGSRIRVVTECVPVEDLAVGGFAGSMTRLSGLAQPTAIGEARRRPDAQSSESESP